MNARAIRELTIVLYSVHTGFDGNGLLRHVFLLGSGHRTLHLGPSGQCTGQMVRSRT
jgi:hypothetical protein